MKIVVTGTRGIPAIQGGVETHCEELYPLFADDKHEIIVVRRPNYAADQSVKTYKGVAIKDIKVIRNKHLEAFLHTFLAVLYAKRSGADIVHIHAVGPAIMTPIVRLLGMKAVVTHHGPDYDREKWGAFAKWILRTGEKNGVKYANHVIVISEHIRKMILRKYPTTNNISLIPNGVKEPLKASGTQFIKSLGLTEYSYILAVGRLVKEKGFDKLVEAFKQLNSPTLKLVIAGSADHQDSYAEKLKELCEAESNICMTGFVKGDKLAELFTYTRLFVLPSTHEGLPIALLEAMSYSTPILASNIPANKEVGLPDECYFKSGDTIDLLNSLKARTDSNGIERIQYDLSPYNWKQVAHQTKKVYDFLMV